MLYDSPVEVSNFKTISFTVKNVPHRIVIDGEGNYDPERMKRDVQKIVEASVELMGGEIPYRDYTFILHLRSNTGGGLEHLNSTALGFRRSGFADQKVVFWACLARVFPSLERKTNQARRTGAV